MSNGLPATAPGASSSSRCAVPSESRASGTSFASARSAAIAAWPPEMVTTATREPPAAVQCSLARHSSDVAISS